MKKKRPCIRCGNKNIKIWDCGYSSFNVGGAKCPCGNKIELSPCGCFPEDEIIDSWNKSNPTLEKFISNKEEEIKELENKIKEKRDEITEITRINMDLKYNKESKSKSENKPNE